MQDQLDQLSMTQLTALQLHLLHQQQEQQQQQLGLPDDWWHNFQAEVLHKAVNCSNQQAVPADTKPANALSVKARATRAAATAVEGAPASISTADADALCTLLCTCHLLSTPPPQQWLASVLQLCTVACQQGRVSTAGGLQLLAACCFGSCRQQPAAGAAQAASLSVLHARMVRLPTPTGVAVLFACLLSGQVTAQVPVGVAEDLGSQLKELLPGLPTALLLQVPQVLAAVGWQGDDRFLAAFALTTQARLAELSWTDLQRLLQGCVVAGMTSMSPVWCEAVIKRLQQLADVEGGADGLAKAFARSSVAGPQQLSLSVPGGVPKGDTAALLRLMDDAGSEHHQ